MDLDRVESYQTNEEKEQYILGLCRKCIENENYAELLEILTKSQESWKSLSTARLSKIIKTVFEQIPITFSTYQDVLSFLNGLVNWASDKKMLKLDLECKLIHVYLSVGKFKECLQKISEVLKELKKYDDKVNLISLYVFESRAYYELKDFSRARSSLTSARSMAVSSACPAYLQAQIDMLNGMYLSDEHSFETSISYFIESLECFYQDKQVENAKTALRYIVLSKILSGKYEDIRGILESKPSVFIKDDPMVVLLCEIAKVCKNRNLKDYSNLLHNNRAALEADSYIYRHLNYVYNILLDQNILKIIEPYSHIKIQFIAKKLGFSEEVVESKLRNMILDKSVVGILDHISQCLLLYEQEEARPKTALQNIQVLNKFFKDD